MNCYGRTFYALGEKYWKSAFKVRLIRKKLYILKYIIWWVLQYVKMQNQSHHKEGYLENKQIKRGPETWRGISYRDLPLVERSKSGYDQIHCKNIWNIQGINNTII